MLDYNEKLMEFLGDDETEEELEQRENEAQRRDEDKGDRQREED